jgi:plastocyanin
MRVAHLFVASAVLVLAACSDDDPVTPPAPALTTVTVTPATASVVQGATTQLSAAALDQNGAAFAGATIAWTSGTPANATVSAAGLVTGVAPGTSTITATATSGTVTRTGTATITVTAPTTATVVSGAAANTFTPQDITIAVNGTVTWTFGARPHNVIFNAVAGAPANVATTTNNSVSRQFPTAGSFPYVCNLHAGMTGTVTVR